MEHGNRNTLITGAAGFIGSQLAYALWKQGENVTLLDDFSYGQEDNLVFPDCDFRKKVHKINILDKERLYALFNKNKFTVVYHIAAITPLPDCQIEPGNAIAVNVAGTANVLEASRIFGTQKVLFASTSAVYENCQHFPTSEKDAITPSLIYSSSKYFAEKICKGYVDVYGMNVGVLRFANVYGPHIDCLRKQPPVVAYLIRELFCDRVPILHSTGEQSRDFIYVDDLLELAILAQVGVGFECINVASGTKHSINEIASILSDIMGKRHLAPSYVNAANYWKKYSALYQGAYPISQHILENEVNKTTLCDPSYAYSKYNWKAAMSLRAGLQKTVEYTVDVLRKAYGEL